MKVTQPSLWPELVPDDVYETTAEPRQPKLTAHDRIMAECAEPPPN